MSWEEEQERFWGWINHPQDLSLDAEAIASMLAPHTHISQAEALAIYNNAYHQRLVEVSSALFPVLFNTLGRELYTKLWLAYMSAHPPRNGPIHRIGEQLAEFLREHPSFRGLPALGDITQLETLLGQLFDQVDETPYTLVALQALPQEDWPAMRWRAGQDWALMNSGFDLEGYWQQMQAYRDAGGEPGAAEFGIETLQPAPDTALPNYLVFRQKQRMQFQRIRPEFSVFLRAVQDNQPFAEICVQLAEQFPEQEIPSLSLRLLLRALELELLRA